MNYGAGNSAEATSLPASTSATEPPTAPEGIQLSGDARSHPDHETVRWLLQTHFDAINFRRYDTWKTTVVTAKHLELPEGKWYSAYGSTRDSHVRVHRIESGVDDSLRVLLSFTSRQDPQDAPDQSSECLRWQVVYSLVQDSAGLRLDTSRLPGSFRYTPC